MTWSPESVAEDLRVIYQDDHGGRRTGAMAFLTIMRAWFAEKEATGRPPNLRPIADIARQLGLDTETLGRLSDLARFYAESQRRVNISSHDARSKGGRPRRWVVEDATGRNHIVTRAG